MQDGKLKTADGVKYVFCKDHGFKDENGNKSGMYMPTPHDHVKWLARKLVKRTAWKDKKKEANATGKRKATEATPNSSSPPIKLSLSRSFKSALITQVHLFDVEAEHIICGVMAKSKEDSEDASLKY